MSQTTLLSSINRTTDYPITVSSTANSHCGTLQLILGSDWTNQMIHELPAINISILTADGSKFLSFDVNMSTVNEELRNKDRSLTPTEPYSIAVYDIPKDITFSITPLFDQYALKAHNDLINDGNIEIFETSDKGIVNTDSEDYTYRLWTTPTSTFDITIIFDNSNVASGGSGGGGGGTSDYTDLVNKPSINNVTLVGNKTLSDLGIVNPMMIKGRVNSVSDLPQVAETGWVYFVGQSDDEDLEEYVYTADNEWEFLGYTSIVIDSALSTTSENPVQNKVITNAMVGEKATGKQFVIDGQTVTAADGAEIFNAYTGSSQNKAVGQYSHAEGAGTRASGSCSHAEGGGTTASGPNSHAEGESTIAASTHQHVQGKYNVSDANGTYAFIIGNGTGNNARHNAFAIDWNGNIYVNGSATGVNVETLSSILNPISESEYDALTTKDKPLYFIYD